MMRVESRMRSGLCAPVGHGKSRKFGAIARALIPNSAQRLSRLARLRDAVAATGLYPLEPRVLLSASDVVINEIMYNSATAETTDEYVELFNKGTTAVDLTGWRITKGIDFTFGNRSLGAGQYVVVAANLTRFAQKYPSISNVVGNWTGQLSNNADTLELQDNLGQQIDQVGYASDGEWAQRRPGALDFNHRGWDWVSGANGLGKSLELINPALSNNKGQNWGASIPDNGTPGAANSIASSDIAPLIGDLSNFPIVPKSNQQVTVTASVTDELTSGLSVSLFYRDDGAASFQSTPMFDDGLHGDGIANDKVFGARLPARPNNTVVEFYVRATDSTAHSRTWPGPTDTSGTQGANALYQVDDTGYTGSQPLFKLIMREAERAELAQIGAPGSADQASNAAMNGTFVSIDGTGSDIRYQIGIRNRGGGSRDATPNNYRVNFGNFNTWHNNAVDLNLNGIFSSDEVIGSALAARAGIPGQWATPVQVRVNNANLASSTQGMFGSYSYVESEDRNFVSSHFPTDDKGNYYRGVDSAHNAKLQYSTDINTYRTLYPKQTNKEANDYTDLVNLTKALDPTQTPDASFASAVNAQIDVKEWMRYFAFNVLVGNGETSLGTGYGDDFGMYRGLTDPRFQLVAHDLDTILGFGDTVVPQNRTIFIATNSASIKRLLQFPDFAPQFFQTLKDMAQTVFTQAELSRVIHHVGDGYIDSATLDALVADGVARAQNALTQIPQTLTVTGTPAKTNGYPRVTNAAELGLMALSGGANALVTKSIRVNGKTATYTPYQGAWSITNTSNTLGLVGGLNRVLVQELDSASKEVARTFVDIWYSLPTGTTIAAGAVSGTWSPANGPYRVAGNITVATGQSLTIQPGTSVFFADGARLTVNGLLTAVGTDTQRIRFTHDPAGTNGTAATWGGVYFANTTQANKLSYTDVEFAGIGGPDTQIAASKADLDHDTWSSPGASQRIIDITGASSFSLTNSVIGTLVNQEPVHFLGSVIAGGQALIQGNVFGTTTGHNDIIDFTGPNRPGPIFQILDNVFTGTGTGGTLADDILDVDGTDAHIEGNVFMNVPSSGISDTNSAISGGLDGTNTSEVVSTRNFFYNVDHAFLMKEGNSVVSVNDTMVHVLTGVFNFNEPGFAASAGLSGYADGDIFYDIALNASGNPVIVQNPPTGSFTVRHSITPSANPLAGLGNLNLNPALLNTASVLDPRIDFALRAISPAIGTGPNGANMGAAVPTGATISGEPAGTTGATTATLTVGGPAIYAYQWRLDNGAWSGIVNVTNPATPSTVIPPIVLSGLANGAHTISVVALNDAGVWQSQSAPTISKTWTVNTALGAHVRINEVLADNQTVLANGATHPDVIELYNDGNATADLTDWGISDNPASPRKFVFPAGTTLGAGQYLLLYADSAKGVPGIHLGFSLSADGEGVYLSNSLAAGGASVDSITFGTQLTDLSIGRLADGVTWGLTQPTLGSANVKAFVGDPSKLKLNEWQAEGVAPFTADFIELYNPDPLPVELTGMTITDRAVGWPTRNAFVPLSFIKGSGFLKLTADGDTTAGANHLNFKLDHDRGEIALFDASKALVDFVFYGPQSTGVSEGLSPDGSAKYTFFNQASPGLSNPAASTQQVTVNLSKVDSVWKYNQTTIPPAPSWTTLGFVDTGTEWQSGAGLIYHEDAALPWPKNTELADTTHPYNSAKLAYYFRRTFSVTNPASFTSLKLRYLIDDGAVFYLNGQEIYRYNMPTGTITSTTQAATNISDATTISAAVDIPVGLLITGNNILAVEVHQNGTASSDLVFGMTLDGVQQVTSAPAAPLRVTELMYNPPGNADVNGDENEFIELQNTGTSALNLTGYKFSAGVDFTFGNLTLAPGAKTVVVKNLAAFQARYGTSLPVAGEYRDALDNNGELIRLEDNLGVLIQEFTYSDAWYPSTDGNGDSLVINNAAAAVGTWSSAGSWHASTAALGTPEIDETTAPPQHAVVVNEVLTHSSGAGDWIELKNTTGAPINIGGWYLSDSGTNLLKYRVPDGTVISANGLLVLDEQTSFGAASQGAIAFSLDSAGDYLYLSSSSAVGVLGAYRDAVHFGAADLNVTMGRYTTSTGRADFVALSQATKGTENAYPLVGPIVISEIQYHPSGNASEFIELHNSGQTAIDLGGWQITNGVTFTFAAGTTILPGGWLLVVPSDPVQFRQSYNMPPSVVIVGPYEGTLANDGDVVELSRPAVLDPGQAGPAPLLLVDRVSYGTSAPWPTSPDGTGPSLARRGQALYGDDAASWIADGGTAAGSPGAGTSIAPPTVAGSLTYVEGRSIRFVFSKDVSTQIHAGDLVLRNDTTGQTIDGSSLTLTYDATSQTATWTSATPWADGDYTATLSASGIHDLGGRALDGNGDGTGGDDYLLKFFTFAGDANRDRSVDFLDLAKLAQNYNSPAGKTWADGDFTGDGVVDFLDLARLAQNYNQTFPTPAAVPTPTPATPATTATTAAVTAAAIATPPTSARAEEGSLLSGNGSSELTRVPAKPQVKSQPVPRPKAVPKPKPSVVDKTRHPQPPVQPHVPPHTAAFSTKRIAQ
jgi:hypothetical protein